MTTRRTSLRVFTPHLAEHSQKASCGFGSNLPSKTKKKLPHPHCSRHCRVQCYARPHPGVRESVLLAMTACQRACRVVHHLQTRFPTRWPKQAHHIVHNVGCHHRQRCGVDPCRPFIEPHGTVMRFCRAPRLCQDDCVQRVCERRRLRNRRLIQGYIHIGSERPCDWKVLLLCDKNTLLSGVRDLPSSGTRCGLLRAQSTKGESVGQQKYMNFQ